LSAIAKAECASENDLRAAHEEHCCRVHAEHPELCRNPQNIHDEKAHFNVSGLSKQRQLNKGKHDIHPLRADVRDVCQWQAQASASIGFEPQIPHTFGRLPHSQNVTF
jgi:hypothetical protein